MLITRYYTNVSRLLFRQNPIIGFFGPHRIGKTSLLKNYLRRTTLRYKVCSGENLRIQKMFMSLDQEIINPFIEGYDLLVIEEATFIPNMEDILKFLIHQKPTMNIILTGSSVVGSGGFSLNLTLFPVSQIELATIFDQNELIDKLEDWLLFGGYPEVISAESKAKKIRLLETIANSYLLKDILAQERVKGSKILLDLLRSVAFQVGKEVSFNELGCQLRIDYKTVERYLALLEKYFILVSLQGFNSYTKKETQRKNKYYFCDNGILNTFLGNFNELTIRNDQNILWENFLFMERTKNCAYHQMMLYRYFWKTWGKHGIDLVEEWGGKIHGYEFKWEDKKNKEEKQWKLAHPEATFSIINQENYLPFCIKSEKESLSNTDSFSIVKIEKPSKLVFPQVQPNDPFYKYLWNLDDDGRIYGLGKDQVTSKYGIQAMKAWKEGVSGKGVTVAILSTGVAYEDYYDPLTDRHYKKAPDFEKTNFLSSLARDYTVDPPDTHANDWMGLGTQECHIIAASINNQFGGCGIAYHANILPITVMQMLPKRFITTAEIMSKAIKHAADSGAKVIMTQVYFTITDTLGHHMFLPGENKLLHDAVKYAHKKGSLIVCSSSYTGKYGVPMGTVVYPGGYQECLAVGCTRFDGNLTSYSNFGDYISIFAPCSDHCDLNQDGIKDGIYTETFNPSQPENGVYSFNQNFYYQFIGSPSGAIAEVAAVAALIFEKHPDWTPDQVRTAIIKSAKHFETSGKDNSIQYCILDAYGAVTYKP